MFVTLDVIKNAMAVVSNQTGTDGEGNYLALADAINDELVAKGWLCWSHKSINCEECAEKLPKQQEHKHTSEGYESCAECKEKVRVARIKNNHHAISNMERALSTYRDRNRVYGNNYKRFGIIMHSLYPKGVDFSTPEQWNRFGIILQMISKLSRYVTDPAAGHIDSVHDMGVYAFMLEELDAEQAGLDVLPPIPLTTVLRDVGPKDVLPGACEHVYKYPCDKYPNKADQCNPAGMPGVIHKCGVLSCTNCGANPEAR